MFSLQQAKVVLEHINVRTERHGDEKEPAADLKIRMNTGNEILSEFHPTLRSMAYKSDEGQTEIEGVEPAFSVRRFGDLIERLRLKYELVGADVSIEFGTGNAASNIDMQTVDVNGFNVELMEGGSVVTMFRVQCRPSGEQIKRLYELLGHEITMTVTPAAEKQGSLGLGQEAA